MACIPSISCGVNFFFPLFLQNHFIGGVIMGRAGKKKGVELDNIYREVAWELKHEAEAEAAREAASHTLEHGADAAITDGSTEETENTEDKGETENE